MGNSPSGPVASGLEALGRVTSATAVPLSDPSWKTLLSFSTPLARFDPAEVQAAIRPLCGSLVYHNSQTLNCQRLLFLLTEQLTQLSAQGAAPSVASSNFVHLARALLKDLIEGLNATQLLAFVELPPTVAAGELGPEIQAEFQGLGGGSLLAALVRAGLGALKDLPARPTPGKYLFQTETVHLLLVMCSTQLYIQAPGSARAAAAVAAGGPSGTQHIFLEALIAQRSAAAPVVQALLAHFIASAPPPAGAAFYVPPEPRGALYFVKAAASAAFWLPYTAYALLRRSGAHAPVSPGASPLGDAAISLLLALYFYSPADIQAVNPFRRALHNLQDADDVTSDGAADAVEGGRGGGAAAASAPYPALFDALCRSLVPLESSVLLLYALLHGTPHFQAYCLARSDTETLILPILELLYTAKGRSANQLYMLLIVLLILSQDSAFAVNVHRVPLRSVPFYRERPLVDTTLGSLLVVLLLRTAHYNLAALRDVYLHTNTLATLANLAPSMTNLSAHTSQRLVHLLQLLYRRHAKLAAAQVDRAAQSQGSMGSSLSAAADAVDADAERAALEMQLYSDFLRIVLEIINAILVNALPSNPELVYALLHQREVFLPFEADARYADLMENVVAVTDHFGKKVDAAVAGGGELSAERILGVIKAAAVGWRKDRLRAFPELKFTYEEEASPEEFFVPYVWSLVVSGLPLSWNLEAITAFVPVGGANDPAPPPTVTSDAETVTPKTADANV